jgi:hypothetical protein
MLRAAASSMKNKTIPAGNNGGRYERLAPLAAFFRGETAA